MPSKKSSSIVILVVVALALYAFLPTILGLRVGDSTLSYFPPFDRTNAAQHDHLGAENWCVAMSIAEGRGYSGPFCVPSGPTAWTPPLLPAILASTYYIANKSKLLTIWFYVLLNALIFAWVAHDVIEMTSDLNRNQQWIATISIASVLLSGFYDNFQRTHDGTLLLLLFHWICRQTIGRERWSYLKWGASGGLASLLSPAITLVWVLVSIPLYFKFTKQSSNGPLGSKPSSSVLLGFLLAGTIGLTIQSPWLFRNAFQFGQLIPIKSNGWFELEQSLLRDEDGIIDFGSDLQHPYSSNLEAGKHANLGELAYIQGRAESLRSAFRENSLKYLEQCMNRLSAATFVYVPLHPNQEYLMWTLFTRILFALPWGIFLSSLALPKPVSEEQKLVLLCISVYLLPYILISFYGRYLVPLTGTRCLLLIWGVDRWLRR